MKPKSGTKVGDRNVDKENQEYQVKQDNGNIQESMRENEKKADDPVGLEANPKASEMGKAIRASEVEARLWKVMESQETNHGITPPFKGAASQCTMLAKGREPAGGCGGIQRQVAWNPVHHRQGSIRLLQHHGPSSVLGTQPFCGVLGCQGSFQLCTL